jgi:hypothetical protein
MILGVEILDIVGYLGTLIVILSFICKDMVRLRFVSVLGCIVLIIYAICKEDIPILLKTISIISIITVNTYWLIKECRKN